jgi:hypothetical protein
MLREGVSGRKIWQCADFVIGNYMSEAIYPTSFTKIPAILAVASGPRSLGWDIPNLGPKPIPTGLSSTTRRFLASPPRSRFRNAYRQDNQSATNSASKLGMQIGVDMASTVLKEFWPDVSRRFSGKNHQ